MDILRNNSKLRKCEQRIYINTNMMKRKREVQGYIARKSIEERDRKTYDEQGHGKEYKGMTSNKLKSANRAIKGKIWKTEIKNVRGLNGKEQELLMEFENTEVLWYSGVDSHVWGKVEVACLMHKDYKNEVKGWELLNAIITNIKLELKDKESYTIISVYAPNESDNMSVKEEFWTKMQKLVGQHHAENVSVVGCGNALGRIIALMLLFKGKRKKIEWMDNLPPGS
ncbi:hypothetical protein ILUMI_03526 [Ignelater luminosus]|uniref:Uncharacterized protein n=1 Tax=Ignelater luminosus TaxID=2038154 RepID=A0A8K0DAM0_IGNLU|nr:hypothetical protein ILUMI_03526 [Ignelater luminosus]